MDKLARTNGKKEMGDLRAKLLKSERRTRLKTILLILPLLGFLLVAFAVPLFWILINAVYNPGIRNGLPNFYQMLRADNSPVPEEEVFKALASDLTTARSKGILPRTIKPLRHQDRKVWRLFTKTSRKIPKQFGGSTKQWFISYNKMWGEPATWTVARRVAKTLTPFYFIHAFDLEHKLSGNFKLKDKKSRIYMGVLANTFEISFFVTLFTFILGYPLAYWIANMQTWKSNLLLVFVLLPFWTSFLVRTYVWILVLQSEGPLNSSLMWLNLIDEPLALIHNRFSVYVAMTHVLLPFMILPTYSVMISIPKEHVKAAVSLGAHPLYAFLKIYFPQTLHGVGAGGFLVFIVALGYYITPALVGGAKDTMISMVIADNINVLLNWGMAAALGIILLIATLILYYCYARIMGLEDLRIS